MQKLGITIVMLLVIGLAITNFGVAQTSGQQSAADQAQQNANQAQGAADQAQQSADQAQQSAGQAQGAASNAADQSSQSTGGVAGAVSGAAKTVGGGVKTGAKKTKEFMVGGSNDQNQGQPGAAAQSQTPGTTSDTSGTAQAQPKGGKLPQSASPLPLLGLLGLGSVSFGVWKARFRR